MDQNQTVNDDLQKAIDNITNTTNVDPVFSDPIAAPSSVPEGDTGELSEAVGPFPEPTIDVTPPAAAPTTQFDPIDTPVATPDPAYAPVPEPVAPEPVAPEPPVIEEPITDNLKMQQVKEAALRDLVPVLGNLKINPNQKFNLYRDIFEELKDYTVLEPAYQAAKEIADDSVRAEALLYLVEAIDKM